MATPKKPGKAGPAYGEPRMSGRTPAYKPISKKAKAGKLIGKPMPPMGGPPPPGPVGSPGMRQSNRWPTYDTGPYVIPAPKVAKKAEPLKTNKMVDAAKNLAKKSAKAAKTIAPGGVVTRGRQAARKSATRRK